MGNNLRTVDVICQHSRTGIVSPMRIRMLDDDGEFQTYTIKGFRDLSHQGAKELSDGVYITDHALVFDCNILAFGRQRVIRLYYEPSTAIWKMTF